VRVLILLAIFFSEAVGAYGQFTHEEMTEIGLRASTNTDQALDSLGLSLTTRLIFTNAARDAI